MAKASSASGCTFSASGGTAAVTGVCFETLCGVALTTFDVCAGAGDKCALGGAEEATQMMAAAA